MVEPVTISELLTSCTTVRELRPATTFSTVSV
jgi:hypothetical protein